jgi:hypothetical protein
MRDENAQNVDFWNHTPKNTCQSPELLISQKTRGAHLDEQGLPPAELALTLPERRGVHRDDSSRRRGPGRAAGSNLEDAINLGVKRKQPNTGTAISECEVL